jgi:hypothetical protein
LATGQKGKLEILKNPAIILATCWNLLSTYGDFIGFFPSKSGDFGAYYFTKSLCMIGTAFLGVTKW